VRRREVIGGLLVVATMGRAQAQQTGKVYRIAVVSAATPVAGISETGSLRYWRAFFEELRRLGYVEGRNLVVERYSGEGRTEHYPELAREVVRRNPDVIFSAAPDLTLEFKAATATIPNVALVGDPVAGGLASSLARPGGNFTGVSADAGTEVWGKRLELLKQTVPRVSRVGLLATRASWESLLGAAMRAAAQRLGISLIGPPLDGTIQEPEYRRVFAAMAQAGADALVVTPDTVNIVNRRLIVELAEKARLPAIYVLREFVEIGGLMAYDPDLPDAMRHIAGQIDQILGGTRPGDIPFYLGTKFALVINLRTAKALGIEMPSSLLAQADEVIE
jgi:putative tryptophan/tyrosine transport system substrate-binding protein